jgi:hypothetical protein
LGLGFAGVAAASGFSPSAFTLAFALAASLLAFLFSFLAFLIAGAIEASSSVGRSLSPESLALGFFGPDLLLFPCEGLPPFKESR